MCGIVGYAGWRETAGVLLDGLERLEYRGYDSAGIALLDEGEIRVFRCKGRLANLRRRLEGRSFPGAVGIGHTRWATHGAPTERNAHPHVAGGVAIVHNGIIENYAELAAQLKARGCRFRSDTDSEVLCHLFATLMAEGRTLVEAVRAGLALVRGSYAVAAVAASEPGVLVAARHESPLIVGLGEGENFVASDVPALLPYTRSVIFLDDGQIAVLGAGAVRIETRDGQAVRVAPSVVNWDPLQAERDGYPHFMLKEIFEQPRAIRDTLRGRLDVHTGEVDLDEALDGLDFAAVRRIVCVACGTSYYASLVGKFFLEHLAGRPVEVDLASEFRYRDPLVDAATLVVLVSQSGETADTLGALREARRKGARTLAICNVVESTLAREAGHVLYTHAGPEIGVASTKAFTSQLVAFILLALYLGRMFGFRNGIDAGVLLENLGSLPDLVDRTLGLQARMRELAARYSDARNFLYLGRGPLYPIALEGALKLKEVSYIHAEGCPAGEIKHGPIALVDENMPVIVLAQRDHVYEKIISNIQEISSRRGRLIAVTDDTITRFDVPVEAHLRVPSVPALLSPFVMVVPLQLFAYHVACERGLDVDKPRNLAKSVTVE
jgi:glucosamine--fructose-6-phosphate aminotransferase (isomerizing)